MLPDLVTTEKLRKKFKNNFDLCNFAIVIGRNTIMSNPQATLRNILDAVDARASEGNVTLEE
jgi:hypothetical protein